jgi:hypothetical protein
VEALTRVRRGRTSAGIRSAATGPGAARDGGDFCRGRWGPAKQDWPDVGKLVAASNSSDGRRARVHRGGGAQLLCCSGDDSRVAFSSGGDGSSWCSAGPVRDSLKVRRGGRLGRAASFWRHWVGAACWRRGRRCCERGDAQGGDEGKRGLISWKLGPAMQKGDARGLGARPGFIGGSSPRLGLLHMPRKVVCWARILGLNLESRSAHGRKKKIGLSYGWVSSGSCIRDAGHHNGHLRH